MPSPSNPQNFNRYGYVLNNPVNFNDPSGHICTNPEDADNGVSSSKCDKADKPLGGNPKVSGNSTGGGLSSGGVGSGRTARLGGGSPSMDDVLPSPETMCGYVIEDYICSMDYSILVDPYSEYSIPRMMQYYPIPLFYPERVDWGSISIDLIGLTADFVPIAQPWATRIEIVDAINTGLEISENTIQVDNLIHGRQSSVDWFGYGLDIASTLPEYGAPASALGLLYNFGKGWSIYFPQPLQGPPAPRFSN